MLLVASVLAILSARIAEKDWDEQAQYVADQEDLKTPGYNKRGIDNPHGKLEKNVEK